MMKHTLYAAIAAGFVLLSAGFARAADCEPLLAELVELYQKEGEKKVAEVLNEPGGRWEKYNQFIILYDTEGVAVGISPDHSYAGLNLADLQSTNGVYMFKEYLALVKAGKSGRIAPSVDWVDPKTNNVVAYSGYTSSLLGGKHFIACTQPRP